MTPVFLLRLFGSGKPLLVFFLLLVSAYCGLQLFIIYHTFLRERSPDVWGHAAYIGFVLRNWTLPQVHDSWQAYQPPLYYLLAAVVAKLTMMNRYYNSLFCVRLLSLLFLMFFIVYGLLFIKESLRERITQLLAGLMLLGWPLLLCIGGRVSNEPMIYPLWAATYYYLLRWHKAENDNAVLVALGLCAVMLLVKTSALVPLGTVGCIMLYRAKVRGYSWRSYLRMDIVIMSLLVLLAAGLNVARPIYYNLHHDVPVNLVIGNVGIDHNYDTIKTTNDVSKFLILDLDILESQPYWNFFDDNSGRQYFWNSYLKSSLFGFVGWPGFQWALCLNMLLVALADYALIGSFLVPSGAPLRISQICVLVAVTAQIADRLMIGTVTTHDGRLTLPVIIPLMALVGQVTEGLGQRRASFMWPGWSLMAAFVFCEAMFMLIYMQSLQGTPYRGYIL